MTDPETETVNIVTVTVPPRILEAALICASTEERRYYLNGVYLHAHAERDGPVLRVVSTDGHRLFVATVPQRDEGAALADWPAEGVILPRVDLKAALPLLSRDKPESAAIAFDRDMRLIEVSAGRMRSPITMRPIEGAFPNYPHVMKSCGNAMAALEKRELAPVCFNERYLRDVGRIAALVAGSGSAVCICACGATDATLFTFECDNVIVIVMPVRLTYAGMSEAPAASEPQS